MSPLKSHRDKRHRQTATGRLRAPTQCRKCCPSLAPDTATGWNLAAGDTDPSAYCLTRTQSISSMNRQRVNARINPAKSWKVDRAGVAERRVYGRTVQVCPPSKVQTIPIGRSAAHVAALSAQIRHGCPPATWTAERSMAPKPWLIAQCGSAGSKVASERHYRPCPKQCARSENALPSAICDGRRASTSNSPSGCTQNWVTLLPSAIKPESMGCQLRR